MGSMHVLSNVCAQLTVICRAIPLRCCHTQASTSAQTPTCTPYVALNASDAGVTNLNMTTDDNTVSVDLPFTFMPLGAYPVTVIRVGSNGHINIARNNNPSTSSACCSATPIITSSRSLPSGISVAHEDLHPGSGNPHGDILTYYNAAAGTFTISYQNVRFYGDTTSTMNAQAILYAGGTVDIRWGMLYGPSATSFVLAGGICTHHSPRL